MNILLIRDDKPNSTKKYLAVIQDNGKIKKVRFGAKTYQDYTIHKDQVRKNAYISRHKKNEDWNNIKTAGFWSKNLLWNKPTIKESIEDIEKRFGVHILYA